MEEEMPMRVESFNDIYTAYYRRSFGFAKSYVHDDLAAEDIAAEALIKLWERLKQTPMTEEQMLPLLITMLKNKALDYLKHDEVRRAAMEEMAGWQQQELAYRISALEECNPNEMFLTEVKDIVTSVLDGLPRQTKQVFLQSRQEGRSHQEIAERMGISVKAVEYHITKSLKALRIALKDYLPLFYFFFGPLP